MLFSAKHVKIQICVNHLASFTKSRSSFIFVFYKGQGMPTQYVCYAFYMFMYLPCLWSSISFIKRDAFKLHN